MKPPRPPLLVLLSSALASGCAVGGSYPSLAPRAVEREDAGTEPVTSSPPVAATDAGLASELARLLAQARQGQTVFEAELVEAGRSVSRAGASQSESWIEAQQAVSALEAARASTVSALAELDALILARGESSVSPTDLGAIAAAAEEVRGLAERQQTEIGRLSASLE